MVSRRQISVSFPTINARREQIEKTIHKKIHKAGFRYKTKNGTHFLHQWAQLAARTFPRKGANKKVKVDGITTNVCLFPNDIDTVNARWEQIEKTIRKKFHKAGFR